ncbi:hypothetical protein T08_6864 [Trichinella sp. T8]|nr:hypothetical protein T08_6864 [Trichinella sp. T8]
MQADLDIHCSDVRLRVHSQLAEMDENLLPVALLRILQKSLLPCEAESQKRNSVHRANCRRCVRCVSDDQNAKSQINYDCPTLTVSTLVCVCTEHESK